jgi:TPP-dependent pyruvate/acetoin dehydrogenase alpha subunit
VYEVAGEAIRRARAGEGPSLIEVRTDRLWGHFEGDADAYRTDEFKAGMAERDAVKVYGQALLDRKVCTEQDLEQSRTRAFSEVEDAIEYARSSPYPKPEDALLHVFA